ncbi:hypothetical protein ACFL2S_03475 [Thermodesulfobacteriota bacterium]
MAKTTGFKLISQGFLENEIFSPIQASCSEKIILKWQLMPIADWSITNPFFFEPKFSVDVVPK